jgi:hypothetical protein
VEDVSIREDLRKRLEELGQKPGYENLNDVIAFLLDAYNYKVDVSKKLANVTETTTSIGLGVQRCLENSKPLHSSSRK